MTSRLELLHLSLSSSGGAVRVFSSIVQVAAGPVSDIGQDGSPSNAIAAQAVRDQASRLELQAVQQMLEETLGSGAIPSILRQDIQHDAVLIDSAP